MKRTLVVSALMCILGFTGMATAADLKVGAINVPRLLTQAPQAEDAREDIEKEFLPRKNDLEAREESLLKLKKRLDRDGDVMSRTERSKIEDDILILTRELRRGGEQFAADFRQRQGEVNQSLMKVINDVIQEMAKEEGYDLIVGEGTIYAADDLDVTDAVLKRLKKAN